MLCNLRNIINGLVDFNTYSSYDITLSMQHIHEDFHSGNIFFSDEYDVKIGDFGICKSVTESTDDNNIIMASFPIWY